MTSALATGFGLGFLVGAQVGPIWLLCLRSVLRGRFIVGIAIGAGAAIIDVAYTCLGVAGMAQLLMISALRVGLGLAGAAVLIFLGARTLWSAMRVRHGGESTEEVDTPRRAFLTSLVATASNPMTIASWAAIFAAASAADVATSASSTVAMLAGIGAGTFSWFLLLSGVTAIARRRVSTRGIVVIDAVSGVGLAGFGGGLVWKSLSGR